MSGITFFPTVFLSVLTFSHDIVPRPLRDESATSDACHAMARGIANNGNVHLWKSIAIYGYDISICGNKTSMCGHVSTYRNVG